MIDCTHLGKRVIQAEVRQSERRRSGVQVEFDIAAPDFAAQHPELYHYTDFDGLKGIVESNTLWATQFDQLNDSTEVTLLKQFMMEPLKERAIKAAQDLSRGIDASESRDEQL
jgi:hypothetical protein